jgi:hypothetical protein
MVKSFPVLGLQRADHRAPQVAAVVVGLRGAPPSVPAQGVEFGAEGLAFLLALAQPE